jgi:hypothetical protein
VRSITYAPQVRFTEPSGPVRLEASQTATPTIQLQIEGPSDFFVAMTTFARPRSIDARERAN